MFNIVLVEPEIPPNTGNVIRLAANTGARLHLVEPLGFEMSDKQLRRAGLDYHEYASVKVHADFDSLLRVGAARRRTASSRCRRTARGRSATSPSRPATGSCSAARRAAWRPALRQRIGPERLLRLPMRPGNRSLNLSNAVAVVVYEAWRQLDYAGGQLSCRLVASPGADESARTVAACALQSLEQQRGRVLDDQQVPVGAPDEAFARAVFEEAQQRVEVALDVHHADRLRPAAATAARSPSRTSPRACRSRRAGR